VTAIPTATYDSTLSWRVEKHRSTDSIVRFVESVNGTKMVDGYGRGASVMRADRPEAARSEERTMN
jgi:hypothetical protein